MPRVNFSASIFGHVAHLFTRHWVVKDELPGSGRFINIMPNVISSRDI